MRRFVVIGLACSLVVAVAPSGAAQESRVAKGRAFVPGEVIVSYRPSPAVHPRTVRGDLGLSLVRRSPALGVELARIPSGASVEDTVAALESDPAVQYAEPNYIYQTDLTPNDPGYPDQWALGDGSSSIDAPEAWTVTTGSSAVRVAVVDTGMDMDHPDLAPNLWTNPGEIAGNLMDDDGNGYVDDVHGYDWSGLDNDPSDAQGHGTHVSGIAAARGNDSIGVSGTSWRSQIVPLRALDDDGFGTTLELAQAFDYAGSMGFPIVNASLGGNGYSLTLENAVKAWPKTLFIVSAGNGGSDGIGDDVETSPSYPCSFPQDNILCVTATDQNDVLAPFANFGAVSVDLAAPGTEILSTLNNDGYGIASGTSMATPYVSGTAALLLSVAPDTTVAKIKSALLDGTQKRTSLAGSTASGGRLNAFSSLAAIAPSLITTTKPEPEPDAEPEPQPEPEPTLDSGLKVRKRSGRAVASGWVAPGQRGAATIKVVLKKRKNGRFRKIARRDPLLTLEQEKSTYKTRLRKPKRGRCRVISTFVDSDGTKTRARRTFNC